MLEGTRSRSARLQRIGEAQGRCEGSEGVQACSLGREPQVRRRPWPQAPQGATAGQRSALCLEPSPARLGGGAPSGRALKSLRFQPQVRASTQPEGKAR